MAFGQRVFPKHGRALFHSTRRSAVIGPLPKIWGLDRAPAPANHVKRIEGTLGPSHPQILGWMPILFQAPTSRKYPDIEKSLISHSSAYLPSFIMSWLRRLSRDRTSKSDPDSFREMPIRTAPFANGDHPQSPTYKDTQYPSTPNSQDKLQSFRPARQPNVFQSSPPRLPGTATDDVPRTPPSQQMAAPDPLTRAFNDAIRPYQDQIEMLKAEIDEKELQLQGLEDERADMHAWIDKRGLRAGKPPNLPLLFNRS